MSVDLFCGVGSLHVVRRKLVFSERSIAVMGGPPCQEFSRVGQRGERPLIWFGAQDDKSVSSAASCSISSLERRTPLPEKRRPGRLCPTKAHEIHPIELPPERGRLFVIPRKSTKGHYFGCRKLIPITVTPPTSSRDWASSFARRPSSSVSSSKSMSRSPAGECQWRYLATAIT